MILTRGVGGACGVFEGLVAVGVCGVFVPCTPYHPRVHPSALTPPPPNMLPNCEKRPENLFLRSISFDSALSMMVGKERRRSVCPVGAVSKTMQLKFMFCTIFISSANDIASSTPGMEFDMSENMLKL